VKGRHIGIIGLEIENAIGLEGEHQAITKHAAAAEHTPQPDGTKGAHRIRDCIRIQDRVASR